MMMNESNTNARALTDRLKAVKMFYSTHLMLIIGFLWSFLFTFFGLCEAVRLLFISIFQHSTFFFKDPSCIKRILLK